MTYLNLDAVEKRFGENTALYPSSLAVDEGEFVVFVGPSGCGKTTFLRLIAGLEEVSSGSIGIAGRDVTWVEPKDRGVAMVFQNYALYPHLTVEKNLLYPLQILKLSKEEKTKRVKEVSELLQIAELLSRKPSELSGGQRQRVAIGRALVRQPDIFLFDEPLSNLDARLREQMRIEILNLHQKLKRTTVYVTHDQHEAMTLSEKLVVMNGGRIVQAGKPLDLYRDPDHLFVAKFLGSPPINLVSGELLKEDLFECGLGQITFEAKDKSHKKLLLAVRPEDIEVKSEKAGEGFQGKIQLLEHLGREVHLRIEAGSSVFWVVLKDRGFSVGENLFLSIPKNKRLWFSPIDEKRIR